jgi:Peptidase C39 family
MKRFLTRVTVLGICVWMLLQAHFPATPPVLVPHSTAVAQRQLIRINQLDPRQYRSKAEYDLWAYSACSTAAMTEIANYYGGHYRITDILATEIGLKEITPQLGLLEDVGIARTMALLGFQTSWGYKRTLDQVIYLADHGTPVIVGWPPSRYPRGHLVVVIRGNGTTVFIADSSIRNRHALARARFSGWWGGFAAVVTPAGSG